MPRNYIGEDTVRFTRTGITLVRMEYYDGRVVEDLEPRRLFPVTGGDRYVALLDRDGIEQAIIRNVDTLIPESAAVIRDALREYYLIPKITAVYEIEEKHGTNRWTVETEYGKRTFQIHSPHTDIRILYDGRILVRDTNDNRYEIPDWKALDKHSRHVLNTQI